MAAPTCMKLYLFCVIISSLIHIRSNAQTVTPGFNSPDTVCINTPVTITNTTSGGTNYYWSFCSANLNTTPEIENLGNVGGMLNQPVFMDYVFTNNNYYAFVTNYRGGDLIRLDFGNSLLNTPTAANLGNFGNILPSDVGTEGIQVIQNEGKWYAIIVSGYPPSGSSPKIVKIAFGPDIKNPAPIATDWGNLGNMYQPIDLHLFKENDNWYGFTVNAENNTITRFEFSSSFENTPTATNLGNLGGLQYPTGLYAINDNGTWRLFITNAGDRIRGVGEFSLTRLDFGNSLLNIPTAVNLGNLGHTLVHPRDLTILKSCNQTIGFIVNGYSGYTNLVRIDFNNNLSSHPSATSLPTTGFNFPHSISRLFRVNEVVYGFITDAENNTISRMRLSGCTNANIPNSQDRNPPAVTYDVPGIYNINLNVDLGLATQSSYCKQIVVLPCSDTIILTNDTTICSGLSIQLNTINADSYTWSPALYLDDPTSSSPVATPLQDVKYYVDAFFEETNTTLRDSILIRLRPRPHFTTTGNQSVCEGSPVTLSASGGDIYSWSPGSNVSNPHTAITTATPTSNTIYTVEITDNTCNYDTTINLAVTVNPNPTVVAAKSNDINCNVPTVRLQATGAKEYKWTPAAGMEDASIPNPVATTDSTTIFEVTGTNEFGCSSTAQVTVNVDKGGIAHFMLPNVFSPNGDGKNDCFGIRQWGSARIEQFFIYNRWGQIVFQTNSHTQCWDGRVNGIPQQAGGYVYVIKASTFCGQVTRKGMLTLIR